MTLKEEIQENVKKQIKDFKKTLKPDEICKDIKKFNPDKHKFFYGDADFEKITDLGVLEMIEDGADFIDSQVKNLGNLTTIGGNANFQKSQVENLGNLTSIGGAADFIDSQIENLGNLTTIGGNANFAHSQVKNLGNLTIIGGAADFIDSQVKDLGNLTTIGGNADFIESQVENLGNLTTIGGGIYANGNKLTQQQVKDHLNKMNEVFFVERNTILYLSEINPNDYIIPDSSKIRKKNIMALQKSGEWDKKPIDAFLKDELPLGKIYLNSDGTFGEQFKKYY